MKGLEPIRRETLDPKSSAATNYATCAVCSAKLTPLFEIYKLKFYSPFELFPDESVIYCVRTTITKK